MSLMFHGSKGSLEQRWILYALLRDNVQHHLEGGEETDQFAALHQVVSALGGKSIQVGAVQLHQEIARAKAALVNRDINQLAIGSRTGAIVNHQFPFPSKTRTMLVRDWGGTLPEMKGAREIGDVFGSLVEGLFKITEDAAPGDQIEVIDL